MKCWLLAFVIGAPLTAQLPPCLNLVNRWACEADVYFQGRAPQAGVPHDDLQHMGGAVAGWGDWDGDGEFELLFGGLQHSIEECPLGDADPRFAYTYGRAWLSLSLWQTQGRCTLSMGSRSLPHSEHSQQVKSPCLR